MIKMNSEDILQVTFNPISGWVTVDVKQQKFNQRNHNIPNWLKEKGCDVLLYGWAGYADARVNDEWYQVDLKKKTLGPETQNIKEYFKSVALSYAMSEEDYDPDTPVRIVGL